MAARKTKEELEKLSRERLVKRELKAKNRAEKLRIKRAKLAIEMKGVTIITLVGSSSLISLIETVGVKNRVRYYNNVATGKKIHDNGLVFGDGFEIRGVSKRFADYSDAEIIEKRERIQGYKAYPAKLPFD